MHTYGRLLKKFIPLGFCLWLIMGAFPIQKGFADKDKSGQSNYIHTPTLTQEEKEYIVQNPVLTVVVMDKFAPLQYFDENGEMKGISKLVLDEISKMTGFIFEYEKVGSLDEISRKGDLLSGASYYYAIQKSPNLVLSQPYLKSSVILYVRASLDARNLDDKIYAAISGSKLAKGVKEENAIYFDTREESLDAVNSGKADYGYGNAFSVAFYTLQNGYKNIVTIPQEKEPREYCMGFINEDKLLASIINKSLSSINEEKMQNIILEVTSNADRKLTLSTIFHTYSIEIITIILIAIGILMFGIFMYMRANEELKMQNKRHEILSEISNEYLYEYNVKKDSLILSDKCDGLFGVNGLIENYSNVVKNEMKKGELENISPIMIFNQLLDKNDKNHEISLPLSNGEVGIFKVISSMVYGRSGRVEYVIGKLIDISEEKAEKQELINKAQIDGLTGLYNAATSIDLITKSINHLNKGTMDSLILLDLDLFKDINDGYGHYTGNMVLEGVSKALRITFRSTDIIGRMGGDEFCVYMKNIHSMEFVQEKCQWLSKIIRKTSDEVTVSASIGISLVKEAQPFAKVFQMADDALYQSKRKGEGQITIFTEQQEGIK